MSRNLIARIAVAVVTIPAILWISYTGGWWLFGMVALFAMIAIVEFLIAEGFGVSSLRFWLASLAVALILVLVAVDLVWSQGSGIVGQFYLKNVAVVVLGFVLIAGMLLGLGREPAGDIFKSYSRLIFGVIYVGTLYPVVFLIGARDWLPFPDGFSGGDCLLFLFGIIWIGDTAAMWIGAWIGKHKLAPTVSPNKTVEGFIGGLVGAAIVGIVMMSWKFSGILWYHVLIIAVGSSICGQLGDLVESMWKRSLGIKDSSAIIPGHGGILDRFDSLLFAAPFMYVYLAEVVIR